MASSKKEFDPSLSVSTATDAALSAFVDAPLVEDLKSVPGSLVRGRQTRSQGLHAQLSRRQRGLMIDVEFEGEEEEELAAAFRGLSFEGSKSSAGAGQLLWLEPPFPSPSRQKRGEEGALC